MARFTAAELLEEARRETRMRRRVYAERVGAGKMTQRDAERKVALMEEIEAVLERLEQGERLL